MHKNLSCILKRDWSNIKIIQMFNLGSKEIVIIALVIMFLFGSKKLTEWAKGLGEAGKELKKAKREFTSAIDETERELKKDLDLSGEIREKKKKKEAQDEDI